MKVNDLLIGMLFIVALLLWILLLHTQHQFKSLKKEWAIWKFNNTEKFVKRSAYTWAPVAGEIDSAFIKVYYLDGDSVIISDLKAKTNSGD